MRTTIAGLALAALLAQAAASAATIGPFGGNTARPGVSATIGITVPLGGRRGSADQRPRAELRLGGTVPVSAPSPSLRAIGVRGSDGATPAPAVLALSFGEKTRWYAGGRPLGVDQDETPEDDDGIDTLEGIGIGVGVILAVGVAAVAAFVINANDCDPGECN